MITFVYGRCGSGKSEYVYRGVCDDVRAGKKVILIVPEQEVLRVERLLAARLEGVNSMGLEIVSFRRLCNRAFREFGGLCKNYISKGGQAVLMWRALCELRGTLKYYCASDPSDYALLDRFLRFVSLMKAYRVTPDRFAAAADALSEDDGLLNDKAGDIAAVYQRYDALLQGSYDDAADDAEAAHELFALHGFIPDCEVYLDSFLGYTPVEQQILSDIFAGANNTTLTLLRNGDGTDFPRTEQTFAAVNRLCAEAGERPHVVELEGVRRFNSPALEYLCLNYLDHAAAPYASQGGQAPVEFFACGDNYDEAETIAADIRRRVREDGMRYRDFAVILRDPERARGVIDAALADQGIPFHFSSRDDVSAYPMARFLLGALRIIEYNWRREDVTSFIKTGLTALTDEECDAVDNYSALWSINGRSRWCSVWNMNPDGFSDKVGDATRERLDYLNAIRVKLTAPLEGLADSLGGAGGLSQCAEMLYDLLVNCGVRDRVETTDDADVWNAVCGALTDISICAGNDACDVDAAQKLLCAVFSYTGIGSIPSSADEVAVEGASLSRVGTVKRVYLCSVNDGEFPANASDPGFFDDVELDALSRVGIKFDNSGEERAGDESLYFYRSAFCASDSLVLSHVKIGADGKKKLPSIAYSRMRDLLPDVTETDSGALDPLRYVESDKYAAGLIARLPAGEVRAAVNAVLCADAEDGVPLVVGEGKLSDQVIALLNPGDMRVTQSQLEAFTDCPLKYCCGYVFKLGELNSEAVASHKAVGNYVHAILERYYKRAKEGTADPDVSVEVARIADEYETASFGDPERLPPRDAALLGRLRGTCVKLIDDINAEIAETGFKPVYLELGIGRRAEDMVDSFKVELEDGTNVSLFGVIDRVDVMRIGDDAYVRIADYKTGTGKKLSPDDAGKGKNLQMLLYIMSICSGTNERIKNDLGVKGSLLPAGVEYYIAIDPVETVDSEESLERARGSNGAAKAKRRGYLIVDDRLAAVLGDDTRWVPVDSNNKPCKIDAAQFEQIRQDVIRSLSESAAGIRRGECSASGQGKACDYCSFGGICRKEI